MQKAKSNRAKGEEINELVNVRISKWNARVWSGAESKEQKAMGKRQIVIAIKVTEVGRCARRRGGRRGGRKLAN
jgi:hypothetical protein